MAANVDDLAQEIESLDEDKLAAATKKKGKFSLKQIADFLRQKKEIQILLTGKTGSGKSTLINGILGFPACKEGTSIKSRCTSEVAKFECEKGKTKVVVWDSPGLQDGTADQESYLRDMHEKCGKLDLIMYCVKMNETRFVRGADNPDAAAIMKLTDTFGTGFWEKVVFILTFANAVEATHVEWDDFEPEERSQAFQELLQEWGEAIGEVLIHDAHVPSTTVANLKFIPAGHSKRPKLPDRDYWLSDLWCGCMHTMQSPTARAALLELNKDRIKKPNEVKDSDFKKDIHEQPIVISEKTKWAECLATAWKTGVGGALTGATIGGTIGGPIGATVGAGVGFVAGVAIGILSF